jgi:hypothetical protein
MATESQLRLRVIYVATYIAFDEELDRLTDFGDTSHARALAQQIGQLEKRLKS